MRPTSMPSLSRWAAEGSWRGSAPTSSSSVPRSVIGVEPDDAPTLHRALAEDAGHPRPVGIFADGVAVRQIGAETFRLAQQVVDEVILVSTDEICAAIKDIFDDTRSIAEPSGALAVAGLEVCGEGAQVRGASSRSTQAPT